MDILNTIQSGLGGEKKNDLLTGISEILGGQGGLQNLISQFDAKGLGDVIGSWVGTGQNKSISAEQIQNILGSDALSGIASKLGINVSDLSGSAFKSSTRRC
jgi:uncharacterized protein YidB (DUF937 family)